MTTTTTREAVGEAAIEVSGASRTENSVDRALAALRADVAALRDRVAILEASAARPAITSRGSPFGESVGILARGSADDSPFGDDRDRAFLATIAAAVGDHAFSAAELLAHARTDLALAEALKDSTPRHVGKRLHALAGRQSGDVELVRVGRDRDGVIWACKWRGSLT